MHVQGVCKGILFQNQYGSSLYARTQQHHANARMTTLLTDLIRQYASHSHVFIFALLLQGKTFQNQLAAASETTIGQSQTKWTVRQLPALDDNYIFIARSVATGEVIVVDPGDGDAVLSALKAWKWPTVDYILLTHHHR
jgi:hypothetical protein